jgi:hypothetical protein
VRHEKTDSSLQVAAYSRTGESQCSGLFLGNLALQPSEVGLVSYNFAAMEPNKD